MHFGSRVGRWTAFIPAMFTPSLRLFLFYSSHDTTASAVVKAPLVQDASVQTIETVRRYRVEFKLVPFDEGDPHPPATLEGGGGFPSSENDVLAFLQAIVDEAAANGVFATGMKEASRELSAVRDHLADMRRLVFDPAALVQLAEKPR